MTVWEAIQGGEYFMIVLALILAVIVVFCWLRESKLLKQKKSYSDLMQRVRDYIMEGDIENALNICEVIDSPGSMVVSTGIKHIGDNMTDLKSSMESVAQIEKDNLDVGNRWLRFFAVIAPLLGLAGTLIGITDRLRDLGESPYIVDIADLAGTLAPTIVTTVAGLIVGILALIAFTLLETSIESSRRRIDELIVELSDLLNEPS